MSLKELHTALLTGNRQIITEALTGCVGVPQPVQFHIKIGMFATARKVLGEHLQTIGEPMQAAPQHRPSRIQHLAMLVSTDQLQDGARQRVYTAMQGMERDMREALAALEAADSLLRAHGYAMDGKKTARVRKMIDQLKESLK